jgi:DNA mismatch repair protein MutS
MATHAANWAGAPSANLPPNENLALPFRSILSGKSESAQNREEAPDFLADLHLDQIISSIVEGKDEYHLQSFFYTHLRDPDEINYRHELFRDLEDESLWKSIQSFAQDMRTMRTDLERSGKLCYRQQKQSALLSAIETYCGAVSRLTEDLRTANLHSRGFLGLREFLHIYSQSEGFVSLAADTQNLRSDLSRIRYCVHIEGKRIRVSRYDSEPDYGADVLQTFERFKQGAPRQYRFRNSDSGDMNHVEAAVLDLIAKLYPDTFSSLERYTERYASYVNPVIAAFDREVQFYISCLEYMKQFRTAGLKVCYPVVSGHSKEVSGLEVFDLALASRLTRERSPVITNDFELRSPERVVVVSGPNQGGKTTFARTFGQMHYLGSIGCPVAGSVARLFLYDRLFTHFEREEDLRNLIGKLEDELIRIRRTLDEATPNSILIMNESFLSTTLNDALFLSSRILKRVIELDMLCVTVTFLDELAAMSETAVSMVSMVDPKDPALRTFKVVRRPPDGLAYAAAIAEKHQLTYEMVKKRLARSAKKP